MGGGVRTSSKERSPAAADQLRPGSRAEAGPEELALPETDFWLEDELVEDERADLEDKPLLAEEPPAEKSMGRAGSSTVRTATKIGKPVLQF